MAENNEEELKNMQYVYTGFMKSVTARAVSHLFTFDFDILKLTVTLGQVLIGLFGTLGIGFLGFIAFTKLGGISTAVPVIFILVGMFGLLVMTVLNKGAIPRSKIGSNMQNFSGDGNKTKIQYLYTGMTPNGKGYIDFEDGRVGRLYLVDGILSKTTMVKPLELSAQQREQNYIGRVDDVQEDNHTLVSNLNKEEALQLIRDGIENERVQRGNNHSLFYKPFMDMQEKMMKLSNTSILDQYMILSAESLDSLENEEISLASSGALTSMIAIKNQKKMTKILKEIAFFEE